ncbi:hypothetical protein ScPMuIL_013119 [Solemya velum]
MGTHRTGERWRGGSVFGGIDNYWNGTFRIWRRSSVFGYRKRKPQYCLIRLLFTNNAELVTQLLTVNSG